MARSQRFHRPLTVAIADLDLLRNINNSYGHLAGDEVLIKVSDILKTQFRDYDVVSRFGGEEFAILLPETTIHDAYHRIESIRKQIEAYEIALPTVRKSIKVTISFGIAEINGDDQTPKDIIHKSDLAVYKAKLEGRNRSCIYSEV